MLVMCVWGVWFVWVIDYWYNTDNRCLWFENWWWAVKCCCKLLYMSSCSQKEGRKLLFDNALNTFYLQLHGIGQHWLLFYMHHPTDRITHTMACISPIVEHWLEEEIVELVEAPTHRTMSGCSTTELQNHYGMHWISMYTRGIHHHRHFYKVL